MLSQKIISLLKGLEDPRHPLLGPNIKILYQFGIWQTASTKFRNKIYNIIHFSSIFYVLSQFIDLYLQLNDINKVLNNLPLTCVGFISCAKCFSFVLRQAEWRNLAENISEEELTQLKKQDEEVLRKMKEYKMYARAISYMFCVLVTITVVVLIGTPFLKLLTSASYRQNIDDGIAEYPQIMGCWFPFEYTTMPGYLYACILQIAMTIQGSGVLAGHDANAITIMTFMKGQIQILKIKCMNIFESKESDGSKIFLNRIRECHRHHNFLIQ